MFIQKFLLLISFSIQALCICDHEWVSFRDVNLLKSQGVSAGFFKSNVPAYIGQAETPRGFLVPGRIQTENPKGLYYSANMRIEKTSKSVEFLRKNSDFNYTWVEVDRERCISNGVVVDDNYYIGRTLEGDFTYLGHVKIGEKGLKYENSQGRSILTNSYEILTCEENSQNDKVSELDKKLKDCEENENNLIKKTRDLEVENSKLKTANETCTELLTIIKEVNELYKEKLSKQNEDEDIDIRSKEITTEQPNAQDCTEYENENNQLKAKIRKFEEEIENYKKNVVELQKSLTAADVEINHLKSENINLKIQPTPAACVGVNGCVNALRSVNELTKDEIDTLLQIIRDKVSREDQNKFNAE